MTVKQLKNYLENIPDHTMITILEKGERDILSSTYPVSIEMKKTIIEHHDEDKVVDTLCFTFTHNVFSSPSSDN